MSIRPLTDRYAVSPQITPQDLPALRAAGYTTIIDNRPDGEIPPPLHSAEMRRAAEAAGFVFVENPVIGGAITLENVARQRAAIDAADGPVLAYCASGNRSSIVWALANAGRMPTDELIALPARHGYRLEDFRRDIDRLAAETS
ncbi:TIGR01244 family phosphatase [Cereibacter sphaeroides]|uniref:TIGR01244 family sulfur transferase n=1 Tax=Cereibacter sphaeroides TaxID=1063 RepID=UPI001F3A622E|nr:protein tyrosine phosphatase family protein [Cereibacter sphaeroides]MCE6952678.1 TIGR01244 family phosphatase [Cereibacter sphaeroides]MCE6962225.1 TIGR01244 family phosphatase [Cereibacter sphaeroides]MCE6971001.1 TIGR01244 family phosphatase [Cereibacter sphaeroides]MCE6972405.1 TIGR01244 family phosphatase [Cereibacter sphaeroides]